MGELQPKDFRIKPDLPPKEYLRFQKPFNDGYQKLQNEALWKRLLWGMPLFLCMVGAFITMDTTLTKIAPFLRQIMSEGVWTASSGEALTLRPLYQVTFLDKILGPITICFLPSLSGSDPIARLHMISFLADCGPLYGIWLLESYRQTYGCGHDLITTVVGMIAQLMSIAKTAPAYCLLDFLQSPLLKILVGDRGSVRVSAAKALLPTLILGYYSLTWTSFMIPDLMMKQRINALWQLFPLLIFLVQRAFMFTNSNKSIASPPGSRTTIKESIRHVRRTVLSLAAISSITFLYVRFSVPENSSLTEIFIPTLADYYSPVESFSSGIGRFLRYDEIFSLGSGMVWILVSLRDLQLYGISIPWLKVVGSLATVTWLLGPGTAFALGWLWREEKLAKIWLRVSEDRR